MVPTYLDGCKLSEIDSSQRSGCAFVDKEVNGMLEGRSGYPKVLLFFFFPPYETIFTIFISVRAFFITLPKLQ
jgi:hypothetical protein